MKMTIKAYAKLNLSLDIKEKLPNGYHIIETVFQSISLHDIVKIEIGKEKNEVLCSEGNIAMEDNICYKALVSFYEKTKIEDFCKIEIEKNIPLAAGLAGGSADAAAVLRGLNYLYKNPLKEAELLALGASIGADVPFCMIGGTMKADGIGEKLSPLPKMMDCDIVIIKAGEKPSTGALYNKMDSLKDYPRPDVDALIQGLNEGDLKKTCAAVRNVFEEAWEKDIKEQKRILLRFKAFCAELSGSGPSVFGIFKKGEGVMPQELLTDAFDEVYLCNPMAKGYEFV